MFNPFWNAEDRRLRAFWRLLIQLSTFLVLNVVLGAMLLAAIAVIATGSLENITNFDPASLQVQVMLTMVATISMTLSLWLVGLLVDRRYFSEFGFAINRAWWQDLGFGLALGIGLMAAIFVVQLLAGWITLEATFVAPSGTAFAVGFGLAFIRFVGIGIYEEMLSRGYQLLNIAEGMHVSFITARQAVLLGWVISSAIFGLLHATNPNANILSTLNIVVAGLMLGLPFVLTRSLAIPIGLHIAWNFAQGNVFGFPVSGTSVNEITIFSVTQNGPDWLTGGAFGPEGGFIGLVAMLVGMILIVAWTHRRTGKIAIDERIAIYTPPQKTKPTNKQDMQAVEEQIRDMLG